MNDEEGEENRTHQEAWGHIGDQPTVFLFDPGSTHYITYHEMATSLGITLSFEGGKGASPTFKNAPVNVIKLSASLLRIQLQNYVAT